jgi:hypothetical protein
MAWTKTWGGLRDEIIRLGFESASDAATVKENLPTIIDAANRSIEINNEFIPAIARMSKVKSSSGIERVELPGRLDHVTVETDYILPYSNYQTEPGNVIVLFEAGTYNIFYEKELTKITDSTTDDFVLENDLHVLELIPVFAAYYVWLDDDIQKAMTYYNQYTETRNEIYQKLQTDVQSVQGVVIGGF